MIPALAADRPSSCETGVRPPPLMAPRTPQSLPMIPARLPLNTSLLLIPPLLHLNPFPIVCRRYRPTLRRFWTLTARPGNRDIIRSTHLRWISREVMPIC